MKNASSSAPEAFAAGRKKVFFFHFIYKSPNVRSQNICKPLSL